MTAADLAAQVREYLGSPFAFAALDALLARCETAEKERDECERQFQEKVDDLLAALARAEAAEKAHGETLVKHHRELIALKAAEARVKELEENFKRNLRLATEELRAALKAMASERDDYRFWNERVRVCENHTQDVAAPVGDCLICNIDAAEARVAALETALREIEGTATARVSVVGDIVRRALAASAEEEA